MDKFSEVDKRGQDKVIPIIDNVFKKCKDVKIEQHFADKGRVDLFVTATTHNDITKTYAIECKDRWFPSDKYQECMLNPDKWGWLMAYKKLGYKPLFINTFSDNRYIIWDVSMKDWDVGVFNVPVTTVENNGRTQEPRFLLPIEDSIFSGSTMQSIDLYPLE